MSDIKVFTVRTKGKQRYIAGSFRYSEGQVVRFRSDVVEKTKWIQTAIETGHFEEQGSKSKKAEPKVESKVEVETTVAEEAPKPRKKRTPKKQEEKVEEKVEEVQQEEKPAEDSSENNGE